MIPGGSSTAPLKAIGRSFVEKVKVYPLIFFFWHISMTTDGFSRVSCTNVSSSEACELAKYTVGDTKSAPLLVWSTA